MTTKSNKKAAASTKNTKEEFVFNLESGAAATKISRAQIRERKIKGCEECSAKGAITGNSNEAYIVSTKAGDAAICKTCYTKYLKAFELELKTKKKENAKKKEDAIIDADLNPTNIDDLETDKSGKESSPKKEKKAKKEKKVKTPSPYGTGVALLCKSPNMERGALNDAMTKAGFEPKGKHKAATQTAWNQVRAIVNKLRANKLMK